MRSKWRQYTYIIKYLENTIRTKFRPARLKQACTLFLSVVLITNVNHKYGMQSILTDIYITLLYLGNCITGEMNRPHRF